MNNQNLLGRFPIGVRISTGFFLILLILIAMAWSGYTTTKEADSDFMRYERISTNARRVLAVDAAFSEIRRQTRLYADEGDVKALENVRAAHVKIEATLREAIPSTLDPGRRTNLEKIRSNIHVYISKLDELVSLRARAVQF